MGAQWAVFGGISGFWLLVGVIIPLFIPKGPSKGVAQWCLLLTAICCWLFWVINYLAQINPLQGPKLKQVYIYSMAREWGDPAFAS